MPLSDWTRDSKGNVQCFRSPLGTGAHHRRNERLDKDATRESGMQGLIAKRGGDT